MFVYNRFWHFWHTLNNREYLRVVMISIGMTAAIAVTAFFIFPVLLASWPLVALTVLIIPSLIIAASISFFSKLSNLIYDRQNKSLLHLKRKVNLESPASDDVLFKEQIDYYLNRRVVCPKELLQGRTLTLSKGTLTIKPTINAPLLLKANSILTPIPIIENPANYNRNKAFKIRITGDESLFIKRASTLDALSEVAAREMADLIGFKGLIPSNTVAKDRNLSFQIESQALLTSEESLQSHSPKLGVQKLVAQFVFNLKTASYRSKTRSGQLSQLLYIQSLIPNAKNGLDWFNGLLTNSGDAMNLLNGIDHTSFEENFLLQIILGSQDVNPGNTLFVETSQSGENKVKMYSIDHERIMPDDNYNISKFIPIMNGKNSVAREKAIENVFPMRLWLAGLPQAEVPFSKETIKKTLDSLDPKVLLAYHRQKKLFSPQSVGAQLDRIELIRALFVEEDKKSEITLTPKALFMKFVNNHPTYGFLKNTMGLSDFSTFMLLGQIPEDADWSILRHPLQTARLWSKFLEMVSNEMTDKTEQFSTESFESPYAARCMFFVLAVHQQVVEKTYSQQFSILTETAGLGNG